MASPDNDVTSAAEVAAIEAELEDARSRVASSMSTLGDEISRRTNWQEHVREHPVVALGVALLGGYALGGGLATQATARLLKTGFRVGVQLALLPAIEREIADLAARAGGALAGRGAAEDEQEEEDVTPV